MRACKSPAAEQGPGCMWPPAVPGGNLGSYWCLWAQVSRMDMGLPWIVKDHSLGPTRILRVSLMFSLILSH